MVSLYKLLTIFTHWRYCPTLIKTRTANHSTQSYILPIMSYSLEYDNWYEYQPNVNRLLQIPRIPLTTATTKIIKIYEKNVNKPLKSLKEVQKTSSDQFVRHTRTHTDIKLAPSCRFLSYQSKTKQWLTIHLIDLKKQSTRL